MRSAEHHQPTMLDLFNPSRMEAKGIPAPSEGFIVTHLLIVADQEREGVNARLLAGPQGIRCVAILS